MTAPALPHTFGSYPFGFWPASDWDDNFQALQNGAYFIDGSIPESKLADSGVVATTYGDASHVPQVAINRYGLITSASPIAISIAVSALNDLGAGVGTFLTTPTSANLAAAVTDETGTGSLVFSNNPTFDASATFSGLTASSAVATDASKKLVSVTNTGTGNNVLSDSPSLSGVPTAPTATVGTNTTQVATTAFVLANASAPTGTAGYALIGNGASDATFQAFLQSGTGAVNRTWNDKVKAEVAPEDFGCVGDGVTDDTTNFQKAVTYAGTIGAEVVLGNGKNYLLTGNINVGVGNQSVDIRGRGWQNSKITFSGASVTTGLTLTGVNWSYAGKISNLEIHGVSGALGGITCTYLNHPIVDRCIVNGFDGGYAVKFDGCLMAMFSNNLIGGAGSATLGQVIVEGVTAGSTTFMWLHSRISGDGATGAKCGLQIDNTGDTLIVGGAIESTNTPIMVSGNTSLTGGCGSGTIYDIDLENPGNGNYYLSFGAGWTGAAAGAASNWLIDRVGCAASGTTQMPGAVYLNQTFGLKFSAGALAVASGAPAPTATFVLAGTGNVNTHIDTHPTMAGYSYPWVTVNGTWQKDASPLAPYRQFTLSGPANFGGQTITGSTPTTILYSSQGGYYGELLPFNSTATTMTSLGSTGVRGQQIILISLGAGVTTLQQGTSTNQFNLIGGTNLAMVSGQPYGFVYSGTYWQQMY